MISLAPPPMDMTLVSRKMRSEAVPSMYLRAGAALGPAAAG